jgi:hypothetical protein
MYGYIVSFNILNLIQGNIMSHGGMRGKYERVYELERFYELN